MTQTCYLNSFVDDSKICLSFPIEEMSQAKRKLETDLRLVTEWCCQNSLLINHCTCKDQTCICKEKLHHTTGPLHRPRFCFLADVASDKSPHETIKEKFGINMPQDFYDLWEFCEELNPQRPQGIVC